MYKFQYTGNVAVYEIVLQCFKFGALINMKSSIVSWCLSVCVFLSDNIMRASEILQKISLLNVCVCVFVCVCVISMYFK